MNYVILDVKSRRKEGYVNMNPKKIREMRELLAEEPDNDEAKAYLKTVDDINSRMLTVAEYHVLARRIIGRWAPSHIKASMLNSEDAIDFVAHLVMIGDWNFDESQSTIETHRGNCGKHAIQNYMKTLGRQNKNYSKNFLDDNNEVNAYHSVPDENAPQPFDRMELLESSEDMKRDLSILLGNLNKTQRACVMMHLIDEMSMGDISKELKITREGVRRAIVDGVEIMRSVLGVKLKGAV